MSLAPASPLPHDSELPPAPSSDAAEAAVDSGKGAADENFPVGSFLIAPRLRPAIACFYRFARTADDIADSDRLTPAEKIARLDAMRRALETSESDAASPSWIIRAIALRAVMAEHGVATKHGTDLLSAFRQDAVKSRYETWTELHDYCMRSAAPVGRFLLDLHGESPTAWPASDALCNALQVLNHLQDCAKDYAALDRAYLPLDWMRAEGLDVEALLASHAAPGLRTVIDLCLDATERWIAQARRLPPQLKSRRLAMESTIIVNLAERLAARLRRGDPLATRVALTKADFARAGLGGLWAGIFHRGPQATAR
jgi:squalene synthase HpnC